MVEATLASGIVKSGAERFPTLCLGHTLHGLALGARRGFLSVGWGVSGASVTYFDVYIYISYTYIYTYKKMHIYIYRYTHTYIQQVLDRHQPNAMARSVLP